MKALLTLLLTLLLCSCNPTAYAQQKLPGDSERLLPVLSNEITRFWNDIPIREFPAGVVDQESNWKLKATLKTSRELGCGLAQFTKAYNADGSVRFDALEETKRLDPSLANWGWQDCYSSQFQLRGLVLKLKSNDRDCKTMMEDTVDRLACDAAKYNGGAGSIAKRIRTCRATLGCKPKVWHNNLELQCPQSKAKVAGYGESFCDINSKYPNRVFTRMVKFKGKL
jgi:hypothetical protein